MIENQMQSLETISDIESHLDLEQTEQFDVIYDLVEKAHAEEKLTGIRLSYLYEDDVVVTGEDAKELYRIYKKELTEKTGQELKNIPAAENDASADSTDVDGYTRDLYFSFEERTKDKTITYQEYGYPLRKDFARTWKKIREIQKKNSEPL